MTFDVVSWPMLVLALLVFGFAPGLVLRLIVLLFPRDDPRRQELLGELYIVPRFERPFWVAEQLEVALFEGIRGRLVARRAKRMPTPRAFPHRLEGASGSPERRWRLVAGKRGRVDLAVEADDDGGQMLVIIEVKETNWDEIPASRVMRNLRCHLRQLQGYLGTAIEDMEAGDWTGIAGALIYPARPAHAQTLAAIEAAAAEQAVMLTWYEDVDWHL
jgi:hypothetical protein